MSPPFFIARWSFDLRVPSGVHGSDSGVLAFQLGFDYVPAVYFLVLYPPPLPIESLVALWELQLFIAVGVGAAFYKGRGFVTVRGSLVASQGFQLC